MRPLPSLITYWIHFGQEYPKCPVPGKPKSKFRPGQIHKTWVGPTQLFVIKCKKKKKMRINLIFSLFLFPWSVLITFSILLYHLDCHLVQLNLALTSKDLLYKYFLISKTKNSLFFKFSKSSQSGHWLT